MTEERKQAIRDILFHLDEASDGLEIIRHEDARARKRKGDDLEEMGLVPQLDGEWNNLHSDISMYITFENAIDSIQIKLCKMTGDV